MRHFTARYLEDVGFGEGVFEDVVPGELACPNLSTVVVDALPGWLETPNLETSVEDVVAGRATATMLTSFTMEQASRHKQGSDQVPFTEAAVRRRYPSWLRLAVDTPFLIEDRVLKFTVHREGSGGGSATVGWQVTALLHDGTEYEIVGSAVIPEGETSVQVEIDFDEISLPPTNYASVELYWSWGIPMHSSAAYRQKSVSVVNEDAPLYTRSLVYEPWLYWGDHSKSWEDLSGNGRAGSGASYTDVLAGAPGCYGPAFTNLRRSILSWNTPPYFPAPLTQWSVSSVFKVEEVSSSYYNWVFKSGNVGFVVVPGTNQLAVTWYSNGPRRDFSSVSPGEWQHLVITFDGSTYDAYLNGSQQPIWDQPPPEAASGSDFLAGYGGSGVGQSPGIKHCDFAVWDRVLSSGEIEYIYGGMGN